MAQDEADVSMAVNEIDANAKIGERPYEMIWAKRQEERIPLVDFEDLSGWQVKFYSGAKATFSRSREQQMWGSYVGKLEFQGTSIKSYLVIRPPEPIEIKNDFDCINLWVYGNNWGWEDIDPNNPRVEISIKFQAASGERFEVSLENVRWKEWWIMHKRIPAEILKKMKQPCYFTGIIVKGCKNKKNSWIFFDSLSMYKEELKPLVFEPRPKRNINPQEGQLLGTNTGPGTLPFPVRPQTILPSNIENSFINSCFEQNDNEIVFQYKGADCGIKYVYTPDNGSFGEIQAYLNDKKICIPMENGGIKFNDKSAVALMSLRSKKITDNILTCIFSNGSDNVKYRLWIWQKSLIIEASSSGENISQLVVGYAKGVEIPKFFMVPYISYYRNDPGIILSQGKDPYFVSAWVDWYNSNGSDLFAVTGVKNASSAAFNGGVNYYTKTNGKRNPLFERIFLTISPMYEEVLPTVDNPVSKQAKNAKDYLWQESWGPENYGIEEKRSEKLRSYGISKLIQCNHEISWRDGGEGFTMRTKAAPKKGGDEGLINYIKHQKSLGWRSGLYTNYTDFACVNEFWYEDGVARLPSGDWRPAWPRCYNFKASRSVEMETKLAPIIKKKFDSDAGYTDVHTSPPPWAYTDYDARVPGAGTFAATYYAYGELLLNDQRIFGPIFSEGWMHWMYAGLVTGNYAQHPDYDFYTQPLFVAFDLYKIHPLECDFGMAWTTRQFDKRKDSRYANENIDRFIAATIAYGHLGWLVEENWGIRNTCRSYYLIQQSAKRYALATVKKIEYADKNNKWLSTTEAILKDEIKGSRLHVLYENGLNVFVNWSRDNNWELPASSTKGIKRNVTLPPGGFCVFDKEGFFSATHLVNEKRTDEVISNEYLYLDGRDNWVDNGYILAKGGVAINRKESGALEVINIGGNSEIGIKTDTEFICTALDEFGNELKKDEIKYSRGYAFVSSAAKVRSWILEKKEKEAKPEIILTLEKTKYVTGQTVRGLIEIKPVSQEKLGFNSLSFGFEGDEKKIKFPAVAGEKTKTFKKEVEITVPVDFNPDDHLWLIAEAEVLSGGKIMNIQAYADIFVIPPVEITFINTETLFSNGKAIVYLKVKNNDLGLSKGEIEISSTSDYLSVSPQKIDLSSVPNNKKFVLSLELGKKRNLIAGNFIFNVKTTKTEFEKSIKFRIEANEQKIAVLYNKSIDYQWTIKFRHEEEEPGTALSMASFVICQPDVLICDGIGRPGFDSHPPYGGGVGYTAATFLPVLIPDKPCELRTFIGIRDGAGSGDGVEFSALAITEDGQVHELVKKIWDKQEWYELTADLSEYAGKKIRIKLIADVGPNDSPYCDWAAWGEPIILSKEKEFMLKVQQ